MSDNKIKNSKISPIDNDTLDSRFVIVPKTFKMRDDHSILIHLFDGRINNLPDDKVNEIIRIKLVQSRYDTIANAFKKYRNIVFNQSNATEQPDKRTSLRIRHIVRFFSPFTTKNVPIILRYYTMAQIS